MRHAPALVARVPSRAPFQKLTVVLATVWCLTLLVGSAFGGPQTQGPVPQKTLAEDEGKALRQKAERGDAKAQLDLGLKYVKGDGVPQDNSLAASWFGKAAEQGDATAQSMLSIAYLRGNLGVPQDYVEAYKWMSLAAATATGDGMKVLGAVRVDLERKMTADQVKDAKNRASEWLAAFEKRKK